MLKAFLHDQFLSRTFSFALLISIHLLFVHSGELHLASWISGHHGRSPIRILPLGSFKRCQGPSEPACNLYHELALRMNFHRARAWTVLSQRIASQYSGPYTIIRIVTRRIGHSLDLHFVSTMGRNAHELRSAIVRDNPGASGHIFQDSQPEEASSGVVSFGHCVSNSFYHASLHHTLLDILLNRQICA